MEEPSLLDPYKAGLYTDSLQSHSDGVPSPNLWNKQTTAQVTNNIRKGTV
jgi:hypothetical protein